jgi:Spondin_N
LIHFFSLVWSIYFSDLIGASHTYGKSFWGVNAPASEGLKELSELGQTQTIDNELKEMVN